MPTLTAPTADDFRAALTTIIGKATRDGHAFVEVKSGDLHRIVGGYPGPGHRTPICCSVMRSAMKSADTILAEPPKGNGATLFIRYYLPK